MKIVFRKYKEGDEEGIVDLLKTCFRTYNTWNISVEDWLSYEKTDYGFKRELALVAEHNGKIIGHVHIVLRKIRIGESFIDIGGIANVSTHPNYRGQRIATKLMSLAIKTCHELQPPLSSLLTGYASPAYHIYRKLGYTNTFFLYEYIGTRDKIEKAIHKLSISQEIVFDELKEEHLEQAMKIYGKWSTKYNGMAYRPLEYWKERILKKTYYYSFFYDEKEAGLRIIAKKDNKIIGYALALLGHKTKRPYWPRDSGVVLEVATISNKYLKPLLYEITRRLLKEKVKSIRYMIPYNKSIKEFLRMLEKAKGAIYMDYIIDQTKLFKALIPELIKRLKEIPINENISIDISSPYGCTTLEIKGNEIKIHNKCNSINKIALTRDGIAKLVYGVSTINDLICRDEIIHINVSDKALRILRALFPKKQTYISIIDQW